MELHEPLGTRFLLFLLGMAPAFAAFVAVREGPAYYVFAAVAAIFAAVAINLILPSHALRIGDGRLTIDVGALSSTIRLDSIVSVSQWELRTIGFVWNRVEIEYSSESGTVRTKKLFFNYSLTTEALEELIEEAARQARAKLPEPSWRSS